MDVKKLKESILNNSLSDDFLILLCEENFFVADQYVSKICQNKHCQENYVEELINQDNSSLSLVFDFSNSINILKTEVFNLFYNDYSQFKNNIVICSKIDKKIEPQLIEFIVKIPKLVDWQIKDLQIKSLNKENFMINFLLELKEIIR